MKRVWMLAQVLSVLAATTAQAADSQFLSYVRAKAAELRARDATPESLQDWQQQKTALKQHLTAAWGGFPKEHCDLEPRKLGELQRDGYRVEKIIIQTRPGLWATTNAYVPDKAGKLPAVLCVHGHWSGAKQDPVVQSRCIGLAKLGFFVLAIDAFGAGERAVGEALGEYHGEMTGATLFPIGMPLSGMQVYDNQRAVDYLQSRPEVDGSRIGITGASGGGNQTMYAGTFDERFKAVVPVCSVGNYQAYLGAACCMCEVVPGALRFTEEGGILGMAAPRGLMVVSATKDAPQFSVAAAAKSIAAAKPIFALSQQPDFVRHTIIESGHHYNEPMREAMYGWMTKHLKGEGDGAPIKEPEIKPEDREMLRCFPGDSRPDDFITIPRFAGQEAKRLAAIRPTAKSSDLWIDLKEERRAALEKALLGASTSFVKTAPEAVTAGDKFTLKPEPGIELPVTIERGKNAAKVVVLLDLAGAESATRSDLAAEVRKLGWNLVTLDLRATGSLALAGDKIGNAPDHNSAEWSLWLGYPLMGQWLTDVRRLVDVIESRFEGKPDISLIGTGSAGLVALSVAALDERVTRVAAVGSLASYVTSEPYRGQHLGVMVPGILRDVGDVADIAALSLPRRIVIANPVHPSGKPLTNAELGPAFDSGFQIATVNDVGPKFNVSAGAQAAAIIESLGN